MTAIGSDETGRLWAMRENGGVDAVDGSVHLPSLIPAHSQPAMTCSTLTAISELAIQINTAWPYSANYPVKR